MNFKNLIAGFLCGTILASGVAFGAVQMEMIEVSRNTITMKVDRQGFKSDNFLYDGRTYIQARELCDLLGAEISWDDATRTVNVASKKPTTTQAPTPTPTIKPTNTPTPIPTNSPTPMPKTEVINDADKPLTVTDNKGTREDPIDRYEIGIRGNDEIEFTLVITNIYRGKIAEDYVMESNQFNDKLKSGEEYMLVEAIFGLQKYNGQFSLNDYNFNLISEDGNVYKKECIILEDELERYMYAGAMATGLVAFKVNKDDTKPLVTYNPTFYPENATWYKAY